MTMQPPSADSLQAPSSPVSDVPKLVPTPDPGQGYGSREQETHNLDDASTETRKAIEADQSGSEKPSAMAGLVADGQAAVAGLPVGN